MKPQEILKSEGFVHVYEWHDEPGTKYPVHSHKGKVALFIEKGDVTFNFSDNTTHVVKSGERFDVPIGLEHSATVGSNGCDYIVGEMIEGDS
jgi:quercetin dioxygenase-like cupin family protein